MSAPLPRHTLHSRFPDPQAGAPRRSVTLVLRLLGPCVALTDLLIGVGSGASGGLTRAYQGAPRILQAVVLGAAVGGLFGVANFVLLVAVGVWPGGIVALPLFAGGVLVWIWKGQAIREALYFQDQGPIVMADLSWLADEEGAQIVDPGSPAAVPGPVAAEVFYSTRGGRHFHRAHCRMLRRTPQPLGIGSRERALSMRRPCRVCSS